MEREEALKMLESDAPEVRLRASRILERAGVSDDVGRLRQALAKETHRWVKNGIHRAIASVAGDEEHQRMSGSAHGEEERVLAEIHAQAVEEVSKRLVHELRKSLGVLGVRAQEEIPDYLKSKTYKEWLHLKSFLEAVEKLGSVAAPPTYEEFDLAPIIDDVIEIEASEKQINVKAIGPRPLVVCADESFVKIILANAVRNAIEASEPFQDNSEVVVSWGATDRDYWITVLDGGCGLPKGYHRASEGFRSSKPGHHGMGLATAQRAALSLNGNIELRPRSPAGTAFECRWEVSTL